MNWLDILLAVILLFSFAGALWNGITREVIRIIALLIGIFGGMWWYSGLAPHIEPFSRGRIAGVVRGVRRDRHRLADRRRHDRVAAGDSPSLVRAAMVRPSARRSFRHWCAA